eukprot:3779741-Rhodomonas_salina.1
MDGVRSASSASKSSTARFTPTAARYPVNGCVIVPRVPRRVPGRAVLEGRAPGSGRRVGSLPSRAGAAACLQLAPGQRAAPDRQAARRRVDEALGLPALYVRGVLPLLYTPG